MNGWQTPFAGRLAGAVLALTLAGVPAVFWPKLYDDFTLPKQALLAASGGVLAALCLWDGAWRRMPRWLMVGLAGWGAILVASTVAGLDHWGSVLGYYQYRQGLLTQLAYLALFLAGWTAARYGHWWVFRGAGAGLAAAFTYTAIQALGMDPFAWWIDTSDRAIGTIGNANELSAFAVISLGIAAFLPRQHFAAGAALLWGAGAFIVLEAESRSGLAAVVLFFLLVPAARVLGGQPVWPLVRAVPAVAGALVVVTIASTAAGGLEGTAARVTGHATAAETGGSTRLALWEGTVHVIAEQPLLGVGPDGLHLSFPRWRPAHPGGAYASYDLVAQSSHNYALDLAANFGLPGLAIVGAVIVGCLGASVRAQRRALAAASPDWTVAWAAMAAYGALTMVNPISLAAHALLFTMLGAMAAAATGGEGEPRSAQPSRAGLAVGVPLAAGGLVLAAILPAADLRAQAGWDAYAGGRFAEAAAAYRQAASLVPFERDYARREGVALTAAGSRDPALLARAEAQLTAFDRRFGFDSGVAFNLAAVLIGLGRPEAEVSAVVARAVRLNPHGIATAWYAAQVMEAAHRGGVLVYDDTDRWTYVVPLPQVPDPGGN